MTSSWDSKVTAGELAEALVSREVRTASRTSPIAMAQARQIEAAVRSLTPGVDTAITSVTASADRWDIADAPRQSPDGQPGKAGMSAEEPLAGGTAALITGSAR